MSEESRVNLLPQPDLAESAVSMAATLWAIGAEQSCTIYLTTAGGTSGGVGRLLEKKAKDDDAAYSSSGVSEAWKEAFSLLRLRR